MMKVYQHDARLAEFLHRRQRQLSLRELPPPAPSQSIDFYSNDYLGLAQNPQLYQQWLEACAQQGQYGATGARLISGNHPKISQLEARLADFYQAPAALFFPSGYEANRSVLQTLLRKSDLVFADQAIHASMHQGLKAAQTKVHFFEHNQVQALENLLREHRSKHQGPAYLLLESLYSMDGDLCPLPQMVELVQDYDLAIILDEAHALGVVGESGRGLALAQALQEKIWIRIHTFGKALGGQGAVVLASPIVCKYLINYASALIYSTGPSLASILWLELAHAYLASSEGLALMEKLKNNIRFFNQNLASPIQIWPCADNRMSLEAAAYFGSRGLLLAAVRAPTVPFGSERLRVCLHAYNDFEQITLLKETWQAYQQERGEG